MLLADAAQCGQWFAGDAIRVRDTSWQRIRNRTTSVSSSEHRRGLRETGSVLRHPIYVHKRCRYSSQMPSQQVYDEHSWRLSRIRQLWGELRMTRAATPLYAELIDRIRREAEAYNRGTSDQQSAVNPEWRMTSGHG
jgi:hypothetical protein